MTGEAEDRQAIRELLGDFCRCADERDFDAWTGLFTEDGTMVMPDSRHSGTVALRAFIEADQRPDLQGLHLVGNMAADIAGDNAEVVSDFVFIGPTGDGPNIIVVGKFTDKLKRQKPSWKFYERAVSVSMPPRSGYFD